MFSEELKADLNKGMTMVRLSCWERQWLDKALGVCIRGAGGERMGGRGRDDGAKESK